MAPQSENSNSARPRAMNTVPMSASSFERVVDSLRSYRPNSTKAQPNSENGCCRIKTTSMCLQIS